jgi:ribosomal-protein-alanine N-acetyltransferase
MSSPFTVRVATVDDLESLLQVAEACEGAPHWSVSAWRSLLEVKTDSQWHSVLIANQGGIVSGFVASTGVDDVAELESVAVLQTFRSQGLGRALCVAAMEDAARRGAVAMELEVRAASLAPRKLYASLGFAEEGVRKGYYRDPADDAVLMSVALARPKN